MKKLLISASAIMLLAGCASKPFTYNQEHSRAWNIAHSVGMHKLDDARVPKDQLPGGMDTTAGLVMDTASFMSDFGLGMNFTDAFGLGLLSMLAAPEDMRRRGTMLAWIPATEVESPEKAYLWLTDALKQATVRAMENLEIEYEIVHDNDPRWLFFDDYYVTQLRGTIPDGTQCGAYYQVFPEKISDERAFPDFIAPNSQGYRVWAAEDFKYPGVRIYCAADTFGPYLTFISEISKNLPPSVFLYTPYYEIRKKKESLPPMVHDHGQALLFVVAED